MDIRAYHLPGDVPAAEPVLEQDGVRALAPVLAPAHARAICTDLIQAGATLRGMTDARLSGAIAEAARRLLAPTQAGPLVEAIAAFTGYSPAMSRRVLDRMAGDWTVSATTRLMEAEFGAADALLHFSPRPGAGRSRPMPHRLAFHVFAGNVPGVSVTSLIRSLMVRTPVLGKSAAGEPVLAAAFARALGEVDPEVGTGVAVTWWPGGDTDIEAAVLDSCDLVVHYGGAEAIRSLRRRATPGMPFLDHGPRLSFAVAGPDLEAADLPRLAADVAAAVAVFDQQGCVSPQMLYVIGSPEHARRVAGAIATELEKLADSLPRGRLDVGEVAAIRELRSTAEFRAIAGEDVELWVSQGMAWTVIYDGDPAFSGSCLNRTLFVKCLASLDLLGPITRPFRHLLQTVGIAGFSDADHTALRLAGMGATRVTPIATMPWPPASWHHDGRGPLVELVRWLDVEI